jgi:hypothetical protein
VTLHLRISSLAEMVVHTYNLSYSGDRVHGDQDSRPAWAKESYKTLKQQEEVFRNLDAQYEMARSQTHTQRGMGLGFTSSMRGTDVV